MKYQEGEIVKREVWIKVGNIEYLGELEVAINLVKALGIVVDRVLFTDNSVIFYTRTLYSPQVIVDMMTGLASTKDIDLHVLCGYSEPVSGVPDVFARIGRLGRKMRLE